MRFLVATSPFSLESEAKHVRGKYEVVVAVKSVRRELQKVELHLRAAKPDTGMYHKADVRGLRSPARRRIPIHQLLEMSLCYPKLRASSISIAQFNSSASVINTDSTKFRNQPFSRSG
jgi:hypothetical protein